MSGNNSSGVGSPPIEAWVPEAARVKLRELLCADLARYVVPGLLERLATYPAMKTAVWEKLPPELRGREGLIIEWAYLGRALFPIFPGQQPKTPAGWNEWARQERRQIPVSGYPVQAARYAWLLREEVLGLKAQTDSHWSRLWSGEAAITPDRVLAILEQLHVFYGRMNQEFATTFDELPKVKRWRGVGPRQKFFTEYLSARMAQACGKPLDSIVAALAEVAFDLPQGVAAETIRGRRRLSAPEKSVRKTR
jgi:hypothetical protein